MSIKQELNLTASQTLNITNADDVYPKLTKKMLTNLKEDYNIEKVVGLCREEAKKGKFSYHFRIDCANYYPLHLNMIENCVKELSIELMEPDYDFIVLYNKTSQFYTDVPKIEVIISWL